MTGAGVKVQLGNITLSTVQDDITRRKRGINKDFSVQGHQLVVDVIVVCMELGNRMCQRLELVQDQGAGTQTSPRPGGCSHYIICLSTFKQLITNYLFFIFQL